MIAKHTKHDPIIENRVLGGLIALGRSTKVQAQEAMLMLDENCFVNAERQELFKFIKNLFDKKKPFDEVSVMANLPDSLFDCFQQVIGEEGYLTANMLDHDVKVLREYKILRPAISELKELISFCNENHQSDLCLDKLHNTLHKISNLHLSSDKPYIETYEKVIDEILSSNELPTTIQTKLTTWPPFPASSMITIAGRSGTGKTFLGIYLLEQLLQVQPETQAIYFNLEMQKKTMLNRHATIINRGKECRTMRENITEALSELMSRDVKLVTRPAITIEEIETIARAESLKKPVSVVVVDYIGLVKTKRRYDNRHVEQGEIAQRLAGLAIDLNCNVLTLLQVNREHKNRPVGDKAPLLTDAADSTGCERSSHWWLAIDQPQVDSQELQYKDLFIIKNRKNRSEGGYFTIYMNFKNGCFFEIDQKTVNFTLGDTNEDKKTFKARYGGKN